MEERISIISWIIFCIRYPSLFWIYLKKHKTVTDNPSRRIYVSKIGKKITFKIKTEYYVELLMPEKTKLLGSTKSKITKDENGENVPYLEITEAALIHCNIVKNDYQQDSRVSYTFVPNKLFGQIFNSSPKNFTLLVQHFHILKYGLLINILNH